MSLRVWLVISCLLTACSQKAPAPTENPAPDASALEARALPADAGPAHVAAASTCFASPLQPAFCLPDSPSQLDQNGVQAWFAQRDVIFDPVWPTEIFTRCRELAGDDPSLHCENDVYTYDPIRKEPNFLAGMDLVILGVRNGRRLERLRVPMTVGDELGLLIASHVTVEADAVRIEADVEGCKQARLALAALWKKRWKNLTEELASEAEWSRREITTIRKRQERTDHTRLEAMCRSAGIYRPARGGFWTR